MSVRRIFSPELSGCEMAASWEDTVMETGKESRKEYLFPWIYFDFEESL